ncbi:MAG: ATP F0F1 synthase subunit B [Pseudomonadota bacterium]
MSLLYDSNFLTALSFVIFFAILWYYGVHTLLGRMLDDRAEKIRAELDRARELREEAQRQFAELERKRAEVDDLAAEIVEKARTDGEAMAAKAKDDIAAMVARRLKTAEEQISLAEAQAVEAVKARAIEVAVAAATEVMRAGMNASIANRMIDEGTEKVAGQLH